MKNNLDIFRRDFLNADTWEQRKDGVPLYLLNKLSEDELKVAEHELISSANAGDAWQIMGLGHIRSERALPKLYSLLQESNQSVKLAVAHSIFQICLDPAMINVALEIFPQMTDPYELIEGAYLLPGFRDQRVTDLLVNLKGHNDYLVAYNAARALKMSAKRY